MEDNFVDKMRNSALNSAGRPKQVEQTPCPKTPTTAMFTPMEPQVEHHRGRYASPCWNSTERSGRRLGSESMLRACGDYLVVNMQYKANFMDPMEGKVNHVEHMGGSQLHEHHLGGPAVVDAGVFPDKDIVKVKVMGMSSMEMNKCSTLGRAGARVILRRIAGQCWTTRNRVSLVRSNFKRRGCSGWSENCMS